MSQQIEIEYNALLTEQQYNRLNDTLPFPNEAITQVNHYFETEDFQLKTKRSAIRIREKANEYILTLKEPYEDAILETNTILTERQFRHWIDGKRTAGANVLKQLKALDVHPEALHYYGSLTTERKQFIQNNITYVLDKSFYNGKVDFELEIEAPSHEQGMDTITTLLNKYEIAALNETPKIKRFFMTLEEK